MSVMQIQSNPRAIGALTFHSHSKLSRSSPLTCRLPAASHGLYQHPSRSLPTRLKTAANQKRAATVVATASSSSSNNLPQNPTSMVEQATASVLAALDKHNRQTIDLLNPVNEKEVNFNSTEPIDYPCSLQKEFDVLCSLTKSMLQRLSNSTEVVAKRLDDGGVEGEPCAVLYDMPERKFAAVVFPTAERLDQIKTLAKQDRPLLIINPQWKTEGNLIGDFGIGPWKKAAEDFLAQFTPTYVLKEKRIGNPGTIDVATGTRFASGGVVRLLLTDFNAGFQVYAMAADGSSQMLQQVSSKEPNYKELESMINDGRKRKLEIFDIARYATKMYIDQDDGSGNNDSLLDEGAEDKAAAPTTASDADIDAMDAATLRRMLIKYDQPTSGKISKLRERLKEVMNAV